MLTRREAIIGGGAVVGAGLIGVTVASLDAPVEEMEAGVNGKHWVVEVVEGDGSIIVAAETLRDTGRDDPEAFEVTIHFDNEYRVLSDDMAVLSTDGKEAVMAGSAHDTPWDVEVEEPGVFGTALGAVPVTTLTLDTRRLD